MIFVVASPMVRLDAIRDLKSAGYGASAPSEDDQGDTGYTLFVEEFPAGEVDRVEEIILALDPGAHRVD
jgi:hypothetical protein